MAMNKYIAVLVTILAVGLISGCGRSAEQARVEPQKQVTGTEIKLQPHGGASIEEEKRERLKKIMGTEPMPRAKRTKNYLD